MTTKKVGVYYNLHKHVFSVVSRQSEDYGKVMWHTPHIVLYNVTPRVGEKGRLRVIKEQRKNVHARLFADTFKIADDTPWENMCETLYREVTYNPYLYSTFVYKDTLEEFKGCDMMVCVGKRLFEMN